MYRMANRASFLGRHGASCLAVSYNKLVALEIALKDHLGSAATAHLNHDLPSLLNILAVAGTRQAPPISAATLNSKAQQLTNLLQQLRCSCKQGNRMRVPPANYPYMRYIFHELDGNDPSDAKEADLASIGRVTDDIFNLISGNYRVAI